MLDDADAGTLLAGSLSWSQLEPGHFEASREVADLGAVRVVRRAFKLGLRAQGELQPGKVLVGIVADSETKARWFGSEANSDDIAASGRSIDLCTSGPGSFYSATIDVNEFGDNSDYLPNAVASMSENGNAWLTRDPSTSEQLRRALKTILSSYKRMAETAPIAVRTKLHRTFVPLLALLLERADSAPTAPRSFTRRVAAVRVCEAYVRDHSDNSPTLIDLSVISGLRLRSLINAFQAVTGLSPMAFLKKQRLSGVRRVLQSADPDHTRIIDVAANWGFWHMGHFSADYHAMFGETPSDTLRGN
jgi:AraC family transcriptional regulator, ethanolamine operon transcriptional activator